MKDVCYLVDQKYTAIIRRYSWHYNKKDGNGYLQTNWRCECGDRTTITMHKLIKALELNEYFGSREICPCDSYIGDNGYVIDHKNNDKLDNRVCNLQIITNPENSSKGDHASTSKYIGVCWHKSRSKWHARCKIKGKRYHLGLFDDEIEAAQAYDCFVDENNLDRKKNFKT
jgi:hypothetical protein